MKIRLIALLLLAAAATSMAAEVYTTPAAPDRRRTRERPAPPIAKRDVDGVIPRGIRGGNFLQMFNPRAPRKYGTSQEAITYDQTDPAKWRGIKFFEFRF